MKTLYLFLIPLLLLSFAGSAQAHFLETDGSMGAVLHLDPDDDPLAGQPSAIVLEFKDKAGKFQALNCRCNAELYENGQKIDSQPLFKGNGARDEGSGQATATAVFTFPKKDVYQLKIVGTPLSPDQFQPFTLSFDLRVAKDASAPAATTTDFWHNRWVQLGIILVGILSLLITISRNKHRN